MFDKFSDYMQYLLPAAFKKQKKTNQLLTYCRVIGKMYDTMLESVLRLREETILATCSPEMLEVFGNDYDMPRMQGETYEMYRTRLQMKALVAETAGTQKGILYALASVGYDNCTITPFYLTDSERWAEIRINIFIPSVDEDNPIAFKCVIAEVMKVKKASTLPHWRFYYPIKIWHTDINSIRFAVRFILYISFWGACIYNGKAHYNGELQYDARRNYRTHTLLINRMYVYTKQNAECIHVGIGVQIHNKEYVIAAVRNCYSISFWECALYNSVWRYDGTLDYDTKRRYGMRIASAVRYEAYIMQAIEHKHLALHIRLSNEENVSTRYICRYRVKEPETRNKSRMQIYVAVTTPPEKIDNIYIETCRNAAYFDGTLRYDGTAKYDALYRKEEVE